MKDSTLGILIIVGIILIGISSKGHPNGEGIFSITPQGQLEQSRSQNLQKEIAENQQKLAEAQKKLEAERIKNNESKYKGIVTLSFLARSTDPKQEYIAIRVNKTTENIMVTGWKLVSTSTGSSITIPKSSYLFFADTQNSEENIYLRSDDVLYLITGISPNGASFKVNKCSGYLTQFQNFNPYIGNNCPLPRNEDTSSIPRTAINDACLDYIDGMPSCRIQTNTLPINWSYECKDFIYNKLNYPSCVNTHKNDLDFYQNQWMVYLKRSESIWGSRRGNIILYDNEGKIVSTLMVY